MHLTNYAVNKEAENFIANSDQQKDDIGHKRSMTAILKDINEAKKTNDALLSGEECMSLIKQLIVKTIISSHHHIAHVYKSAKPADLENSLCYQILGFDIFLDEVAKPWLIEVN
mmetsp:Transcript_78242/g.108285  ORF Transcript_78242/g.108285 Transcript_78242/m.108285 type:complete len:114 (-) Transcript_78242:76-417(-)